MNKSKLIDVLAKRENLTIKAAEDAVNTFFKEMEKSLKRLRQAKLLRLRAKNSHFLR
jgi:nucleoid DNA-binding protein